ncbi:1959_t:CDS:2 [Funneliformis caledonium]|uniref:1959_t:CDS:1 n=1 Tax=Funneliformis caledonium TaxID=1117310 RepID=A0A9N8V9G8_9GLOM|nr:1959_t:CDS:2 [Funneliformis caledonium]
MTLALPELLKNILNFLAKNNVLYLTLLVSRLWSRCTGLILWGRIKLISEKQQKKFIKMIRINSRLIFRHNFERSTSFDDTALIKISQKCDKLQFLNISFGGDITGKSFCEIAQSCNGLKHLRISGYRNYITDSIIHDIARSHPNLQSIDIRSSSRLTNTAIYTLTDSCPNLKSLKLEYCDEINDIAIRKIAHCRYLKHLELYNIKALTLHISDSSISKIAKMCPNIIYLDLEYANFIFNRTLKTITEYLYNLEYLGLKGCRRISQKIIDMLFPDLEIGKYYSLLLRR